MWVTDRRSQSYAATVQALVKKWQLDVVHIVYHIMAQYLPAHTQQQTRI
jgi:hypothetical protein